LKVSAITEGNVFTKADSTVKIPVLVGMMQPYLQNVLPPEKSQGETFQVRVVTNENDVQHFNQYLSPINNPDSFQSYDPKYFKNSDVPTQELDNADAGDNWMQKH